ncbi:hypothetical protein J2S43_001522 [Catenuloplanes nepalensis]|uniref:Uncharacterized protein n=1 Tax=Catenuloplanes nepalensis TaxID=587533 RepID=A0ABT9MNK5_9ACTN|nr:hypothetical protein [Catenuloplanes nepalensis]MDP9793010.1 hypothetical protein [Catenuloplanes nepalensis]
MPGREVCLWVTPKIFDDLTDPAPAVEAFLDHHADWLRDRPVTIVFATSNGDHILCWAGDRGARFDWARYNCFADGVPPRAHNLDWLRRVRDGGERSYNPYSAGPAMILSEQPMDYATLAGCYRAFRDGAARRAIDLTLLEYLEPGPEFCRSEWKTRLHPEAAAGGADAGGHVVPGIIDVTLPLAADTRPYAAYPRGVPEGLPAGDFVAAQAGAYTADLGLDGVLLGNQFGLLGFWDPRHAPPVTADRTAGIDRFFARMRAAMGDRRVYWMDTYWRAEIERTAWGMPDTAYRTLDAVLVSTFAVLVERTEIVPNLRSKAALDGPRVLLGLDFVDPWYWYRTYLDDRRTYLYQREVLAEHAALVDGVSFFANDTFGHFVPDGPLTETLAVWSKAS